MKNYKCSMRELINESENISYAAFENLTEAKKIPNSVVILQGDDGGTIYLTCPVKLVKCSEDKLRKLLEYIDKQLWNDLSGAGIYYEIFTEGDIVPGGMDGGIVANGIWIHPEVNNPDIERMANEIIYGLDNDVIDSEEIVKNKDFI